jgi:hypothetical protein
MGHCVQAFIGEQALLEKMQRDFAASSVTPLVQGLALLPLDETFYDAIPEAEESIVVQPGFQFLSAKVLGLMIQYSKQNCLGYFETEYFGGAGDQGAVLVKNGIVVWEPKIGDGS